MLFVFVVDTSWSMATMIPNGLSMLDVAKNAVEHFCRVRSKVPASRQDRYFLITCAGVQIGHSDPQQAFLSTVNNLQVDGLTTLATAMQNAFDLLNRYRHRIQAIDNYGQGRVPWYSEPSSVIVLTDGGQLSSKEGIITKIEMVRHSMQGSELTREPFRWDQRVFTAILQFWKTGSWSKSEEATISTFSDCTGGKSQTISSMRALMQWMEYLGSRLSPGVVCKFEAVSGTTDSSPRPVMALLHVNTDKGNWPLPEHFLPEASMKQLPARLACPLIHYTMDRTEARIREGFPFDRYDIEAGQLSSMFLENTSRTWTVYVQHSLGTGKNPMGKPFGFLKANPAGTGICLYVLPYNFPRLFALLDEARAAKTKPQVDAWRAGMAKYFKDVPFYYCPALRAAFQRANLHHMVTEVVESCGSLSYAVRQYLEQLRSQAKRDFDNDAKVALQDKAPAPETELDVSAFLPNPTKETFSPKLGMEPSQIPRQHLLSALENLRSTMLSQALVGGQIASDTDRRHSLPIAQMGNFHDKLMNREIPRDPFSDDENSNRKVNFGNRYKRSNKANRFALLAVDEADQDQQGTPSALPNAAPNNAAMAKLRQSILTKLRRRQSAEESEPPLKKRETTTEPVQNGVEVDSREFALQRRRFWTEGCIGELYWFFTEQLRCHSPDFAAFRRRWNAVAGDTRLKAEVLLLLRQQAITYRCHSVAKWLDEALPETIPPTL